MPSLPPPVFSCPHGTPQPLQINQSSQHAVHHFNGKSSLHPAIHSFVHSGSSCFDFSVCLPSGFLCLLTTIEQLSNAYLPSSYLLLAATTLPQAAPGPPLRSTCVMMCRADDHNKISLFPCPLACPVLFSSVLSSAVLSRPVMHYSSNPVPRPRRLHYQSRRVVTWRLSVGLSGW